MAFYELRQYSILPGKMDDWVEFMETTIIPFQVSQGMVITASFRAEEMRVSTYGCVASSPRKRANVFMRRSIRAIPGRMILALRFPI